MNGEIDPRVRELCSRIVKREETRMLKLITELTTYCSSLRGSCRQMPTCLPLTEFGVPLPMVISWPFLRPHPSW